MYMFLFFIYFYFLLAFFDFSKCNSAIWSDYGKLLRHNGINYRPFTYVLLEIGFVKAIFFFVSQCLKRRDLKSPRTLSRQSGVLQSVVAHVQYPLIIL